MFLFVLKIITAAVVIAFASWLAGRKPALAGFIIALPLASLLALGFAHLEHGQSERSILFARSILIGVPVSYLFFVPFFLPQRWGVDFWLLYGSGVLLLAGGFFLHRWLTAGL